VEKNLRRVVSASLGYLLALTLVAWFLVLNQGTVSLRPLGLAGSLELAAFGLPLLALIGLRYLAYLTGELVSGEVSKPLEEGLRTWSLSASLYLLALEGVLPTWSKPLLAFYLYASILSTLERVLSTILTEVNPLFDPLLTSVYILMVGYLGSKTWITVYPLLEASASQSPYLAVIQPFIQSGLAEPVNKVIVASTALASVTALLGLGADNPNPTLDALGSQVQGRLPQITLLYFAATYYIFFIRHYLFETSFLDPRLITVGEWLMVCAATYMGYHWVRGYAEERLLALDLPGDWGRHLQKVSWVGDPHMEKLAGLLRGFVDHGHKDELVTHLAILLHQSGLRESQITQILGLLINYRDQPTPRIGFAWQVENTRRRNLQRRLQLVHTLISALQREPPTGEVGGEKVNYDTAPYN